ncbi:MAG: hypothetical protein ABS920_10985 [Sporosarcina sp.]
MDYQYPEFIFLRPVFFTFLIILMALLIIVVFQKRNLVNLFSVVSILFICTFIPAMLLYAEGYIVDEYKLGGDAITMYLFLGIVGLSIITIFLFIAKRNDKNEGYH